MKHASHSALVELAPLLGALRQFDGLRERKSGVFYLKSRAFLHFHEDPAGLFADVKLDASGFTRLRVTTPAEQRKLIQSVDRALTSP